MLALKVQADGVGFFRVDVFHDQFAVALLAFFGGVAEAKQGGVGGEQRVGRAQRVMWMAGPAVVGGVGDHAGAQRVEFDVAMALQQVAFVAHEA